MRRLVRFLVLALAAAHAVGGGLAVAGPRRADVLEELVAKARRARSFRAAYSLNFEARDGARVQPPSGGAIRIDFGAPDRVRVENRMGAQSMVMWCVGDELATMVSTGEEGRGAVYGRVDRSAFRAALGDAERLLEASFPLPAEDDSHYDGPAVMVNWSFDERSQRATFDLLAVTGGADSPLGWLDTLRRKHAVVTADGGRLRFSTDGGRFRGELDAADGMLLSLEGASPNGKFELRRGDFEALESADAAPFVVPDAPPGARDATPELRRSVMRVLHDGLRERIYAAVGRAKGFEAAEQERAEAVLREFHSALLAGSLQDWFELSSRKRATVARQFRAFSQSGRTPAQLEEQRFKELAALRKGLDELERTFDARLELTSRQAGRAHSSALNALERRTFAAAFDAQVRVPELARLEAALKPD